MARKANGLVMRNNLEPTISAPLDGRQLVKTKVDLTAEGSFPHYYKGMIVSVREEGRLYVLNGDPTDEASWTKLAYTTDDMGGGEVDLTEYAKKSDIPSVPTVVSSFTNDAEYQTAQEVGNAIDDKLKGYQASITIDSALSTTSENPVQNKAIKSAIDAATNALVNYYQKSETYSKDEIDEEISKALGEKISYTWTWNAENKRLEISDNVSNEVMTIDMDEIALLSDIPDLVDNITGEFDYFIEWDSTTKEIVANKGDENNEQRLKLTGLVSESELTDVYHDGDIDEITAAEVAALFNGGGSNG